MEMRDRLRRTFGRLPAIPRRSPVGQLVKSLISSRTRDEVSERTYQHLIQHYPRWSDMAAASSAALEQVITGVTHVDRKAEQLSQTLRTIAVDHPDFDLNFLGGWPVDQALAWLEKLPGIGRKVSASTLNFSTLRRPAFVADTHVVRVLSRFGFIDRKAIKAEDAYPAVMAATEDWSADELVELHVLLKRLGQTVCRAPKAVCQRCALSGSCVMAKRSRPPAPLLRVVFSYPPRLPQV